MRKALSEEHELEQDRAIRRKILVNLNQVALPGAIGADAVRAGLKAFYDLDEHYRTRDPNRADRGLAARDEVAPPNIKMVERLGVESMDSVSALDPMLPGLNPHSFKEVHPAARGFSLARLDLESWKALTGLAHDRAAQESNPYLWARVTDVAGFALLASLDVFNERKALNDRGPLERAAGYISGIIGSQPEVTGPLAELQPGPYAELIAQRIPNLHMPALADYS